MKLLAPLAFAAALALPSWVHLPAWAERWMWNPRERTAVALDAIAAGDPERAVRPLQTAARLQPEDPLTQFNSGAGSLAAGDPRDAVGPLEQAAGTAPPDLQPSTQYNLGTAKLGAGDAAGAVQALKQAVRLAPDSEDAKWNLELALRELDRQKQATKQQEAPGGERQGEQESGGGEGADQPADPNQPPKPETPDAQPDPGAGQQPQNAQPKPGETSDKPGRLPQFRNQEDMTAEQAAAILQAVENLERDRRRREAAQARKTQASEEKDW